MVYSLSLVFLSSMYNFIELSVAFPNHKALWRLSKFWLITISALIYF